ncbi:MAG: purine-binding chemotaxis protein CheW [Deltaproteobacteria bacterium]|nr:MAG: purine-binding chemotaxis protein CheW [Deltaproteobacteria bacterium]
MTERSSAPVPRHGARGSGWEELARASARVYAERSDPELEIRELLVFRLEAERLAIPVERVREIVRMRPITRLPRVTGPVLGVVSLRGEIIQVIDLRQRLALPPAEPGRASRIVVLHGEDGRLAGVRVDEVTQVIRVGEAELRPAALAESAPIEARFACGREFVSVIDVGRVLQLDDDG